MRFTLDTNLLVYAVDRDAGDRHCIALDIARRARGRDCVLTLQSLAELFRALTGPKMKVPAALAADIVQEWQDAVIHHGWSFWEAMIWATAKKHGCRILFTEDGQAGRTLGGVTIVNPFGDGGAEFAKAAFGT